MKTKIKKINVFFKSPETYWENVEDKKNDNNINQLIKELLKLAPNEEEKQQLLDDLNKLTEKEKQELEKIYNQEIKPVLNNLQENILNKEFYENHEKVLKELYDKIKELSNKHEKSPEDNEKKRTIKVQLALLNQAFSQSKNNVW